MEYRYHKFISSISLMQQLYTAAVVSCKTIILANACRVHRKIESAALGPMLQDKKWA
jgi:hypothetical protein